MGRLAIILVMSLSLTAGIVAYSINISKTRTVENTSGFQKYTTARDIAHTGVNMMLRTLDRDDTTFVNPLQSGQKVWLVKNYMSGQCSVSIQLKNPAYLDTVYMTSTATFMDTVKKMQLTLRRQPIPFPTIGAAVGLRVPNVDFEMRGTPLIDGHDHDINGNLLPPSANDLPGVGVLSSADSTNVAAYRSTIDGTQDVTINTSMSDPSTFVQEYINAADYNYTTGVYASNMMWGSALDPKIVYVNGSAGMVEFTGSVEGWGIMVVQGSLWLAGSFKFHGLVIGYNDVSIMKDTLTMSTGTPDIIGGVLMAGPSGSTFEMRGNDDVLYSSEALRLARYINKLQAYQVIRWYE